MYTTQPTSKIPFMFLFRMHSIGSVRPVPRASAVATQWWGARAQPEPTKQEEVDPTRRLEPTPPPLEEDVVVIQEEEMVLVRKEQKQEQEQQQAQEQKQEQKQEQQQEPQPQCTEPESTVVEPSKPKYKKKQQKRK